MLAAFGHRGQMSDSPETPDRYSDSANDHQRDAITEETPAVESPETPDSIKEADRANGEGDPDE